MSKSDVSDERLTRLVHSYTDYISAGERNPACLTGKEWGLTTRSVYNYLKIARRRGLLPAVGQGKTWSLDTWEWSKS
jgi:hypothetical protein